MPADSRSPSVQRLRSRSRSASRSPRSDRGGGGPRARSLTRSPIRRSISPRRRSPSPVREARNGRSRSRSAGRGRDRSPLRGTKVVVERLSKNVNLDHLREIFGTYGDVVDLDMPMNRQHNTGRGTAYILYATEDQAESAFSHMHEAQIDGVAVNVSIVLSRRKFSRSPPPARHMKDIRGGPPAPRRRSPPRYGRPDRNMDTYRPRSISRSRSPRRHRSRSRSYSSRSRSPPRRGAPRRDSLGRSNGRRRRSQSLSSRGSPPRKRSRSRSDSRDRDSRRWRG